MISLLLVDDQPAIRTGLRMRLALEADLKIVGEASHGGEALRLTRKLRPDVIVMDVEMPYMDGIMTTEVLHAIMPQITVVLLSLYDDVHTRDRAREAGAAAFVSKQAGDKALLTAIRQAAAPSEGRQTD